MASTSRPLASPSLPTTAAFSIIAESADIISLHSTPSTGGGRRIPSWGSDFTSGMEMDGLPSPAGSMSGTYRRWGSFGRLSESGGEDKSSNSGWGGWEDGIDYEDASSSRSSLGEAAKALQRGSGSVPSPRDERPPTHSTSASGSKSKTVSFFDSELQSLSPPPNPLSRAGSLRETCTSKRDGRLNGGEEGIGSDGTGLARRSTVGSGSMRDSNRNSGYSINSRLDAPLRQLPAFPNFSSSTSSSFPRLALPNTIRPNDSVPASPLALLPIPMEPTSRGGRFLTNLGRPDLWLHPKRATAGSTSSLVLDEPISPRTVTHIEERSLEPGTARPVQVNLHLRTDDQNITPHPGDMVGEFQVVKILGEGSFSQVALATRRAKDASPRIIDEKELFALKMISKRGYDANDRMRISLIREVEVMKHIHHPSLVSLVSSFSTPLHTVLVLDYAPGGELFDFLAVWHRQLTEPLARRLFGELCSAVGWMHSIGLVHRDIKLENILLMSRPFPGSVPPADLLASLPTPFLQLTDFGLSRFVSPSSPLLSTRCGSEAYAAPELLMGKQYDGRQTDTWALGVVLFAIITGELPFMEEIEGKRRAYLMKVAKGQYTWPEQGTEGARLATPELKELVHRLLTREPEKRARVEDIWRSDWMQGSGRPEIVQGWISQGENGSIDGWNRRDEKDS